VEVDSTFYAIPNEKTAQLWVERTPKDFVFDVKAYALLTQHPTPAARLPKDLRERLTASKANLYLKDLSPKDKESVWDRFREGLERESSQVWNSLAADCTHDLILCSLAKKRMHRQADNLT